MGEQIHYPIPFYLFFLSLIVTELQEYCRTGVEEAKEILIVVEYHCCRRYCMISKTLIVFIQILLSLTGMLFFSVATHGQFSYL
jgi:hypothetical protein